MITDVWFQIEERFFPNPTIAAAHHGFVKLRNCDPHYFTYPDPLIYQTFKDLDPETNMIVGGVEAIHHYLLVNDFPIPEPLDYPLPLSSFLKRKILLVKVEDFLKEWESFRGCYVKSFRHKLINGFCLRKMHDLNQLTKLLPSDELWVSEPLNIISEYRFYVLNNTVQGVSHYKGDPLLIPDVEQVREMARRWKDAPVAYSLDVGVTPSDTVLVEANDSFALGFYSLQPLLQTKMLMSRWEELTTRKDKK